MNVQVSMKKVIVIIGLLIVVGLGVWWYVATNDERVANAEMKVLIDFAQKQALEIAIIEQASKLANYKQQIAASRQPKPPVTPVPALSAPDDIE